jgi:DNA topoisomerase-1
MPKKNASAARATSRTGGPPPGTAEQAALPSRRRSRQRKVDPKTAAETAGLVYTNDDTPGITRKRHGRYWRYFAPDGSRITDRRDIERINKLAVPPAYTDVWISPDPNGHLQATGRDARGRKQYRYHPRFREVRDSNKYEHMLDFVAALPQLRERVDADMAQPGLPRTKVLATIVRLLETTLIRVGNDDYAKENKSFGLTTLRDRHVEVSGSTLRFRFRGKSGKDWEVGLQDRRVARIVKASQDLPGQHLFQYIDEDGSRQQVTSTDVNAYLREITGREITAKDFRTWAGTVLAALELATMMLSSGTATKAHLREAVQRVAAQLGNTPAVCRKCYIHPEVVECFLQQDLKLSIKAAEDAGEAAGEDAGSLRAEEKAVLRLLKRRLRQRTAAETAAALA